MQKRKLSTSGLAALWLVSLLLASCAKAQATPTPLSAKPVVLVPTATSTRAVLAPTATQTQAVPTETAAAEPLEQEAAPGCTVVSFLPTPGPTEASLFPPVSDQDWTQGSRDASITIIEYSDFQ